MPRHGKCHRCKKDVENWGLFCLECSRNLEYDRRLLRDAIINYGMSVWKSSYNGEKYNTPQWVFEMRWARPWEEYLKDAHELKLERAKKEMYPTIERLERQINWIDEILRIPYKTAPIKRSSLSVDELEILEEHYKRKEEVQRSKGFTIG